MFKNKYTDIKILADQIGCEWKGFDPYATRLPLFCALKDFLFFF